MLWRMLWLRIVAVLLLPPTLPSQEYTSGNPGAFRLEKISKVINSSLVKQSFGRHPQLLCGAKHS